MADTAILTATTSTRLGSSPRRCAYPFTAVVGQASFKEALILCAINPLLGGLLVSGPKGSAKSTLARALADVLPAHSAPTVTGPKDEYFSEEDTNIYRAPFVNLPLNATEDRIQGALDLESVLQDKQIQFNPGLLAQAHGGVLYVDEVNLLPDHLTDILLDVSSQGVNYVERDGISHAHDARFILLGTMNADEGNVRPQLLDRFGLMAELNENYTAEDRMEIVLRREAFDQNPQSFLEQWHSDQQALTQKILRARQSLVHVNCPAYIRQQISERCMDAKVEGVRADIIWTRAAMAHAAWSDQSTVEQFNLDAVEHYVLMHRRTVAAPASMTSNKHQPSANSNTQAQDNRSEQGSQEQPSQMPRREDFKTNLPHSPSAASSEPAEPSLFSKPSQLETGVSQSQSNGSLANSEQSLPMGEWGSMSPIHQPTAAFNEAQAVNDWMTLRRSNHRSESNIERTVELNASRYKQHQVQKRSLDAHQMSPSRYQQHSSTEDSPLGRPDWVNTLIQSVGEWPPAAIRYRKLRPANNVLHFVMLDSSASTIGTELVGQAKGLIQSLANQAYLKREKLSILAFGNQSVQSYLEPVRSPKSIDKILERIVSGGGTPLKVALETAIERIQNWKKASPNIEIKTYLLTDGRSRDDISALRWPTALNVIDLERSAVKRGRAREFSTILGGEYISL